jgi:hypothetical protein
LTTAAKLQRSFFSRLLLVPLLKVIGMGGVLMMHGTKWTRAKIALLFIECLGFADAFSVFFEALLSFYGWQFHSWGGFGLV